MKEVSKYFKFGAVLLASGVLFACTKLDTKVYSVVPQENFWQTPAQIAAGIAPAYQALQNIPNGNTFEVMSTSGGEMITPTRGNDWYDNGDHQAMWLHNWKPDRGWVNGLWSDYFGGIGKCNFILSQVNALPNKPANIDAIVAELKVVRAYFYYWAMDAFGNVPLVTDFNTNPNQVSNSTTAQVYAFIESDIKSNIQNLSRDVSLATYGRMTVWGAHMLLAKLYLNSGVYIATPRWQDVINETDSVIQGKKFSLPSDYFSNFAVENAGSPENILVVPFDNNYIGGNNWEMETLHYQSNSTFNLAGSPWNGYCVTADVYSSFDPADQRKSMFLVGQQYGSDGTALVDAQTNLPLVFDSNVNSLSDPSAPFRLAGARNIKYHPQAGTAGNQSNDMVLFRLADAYLMRAEAELNSGDNASALSDVNIVRERAFKEAPGGPHDLTTLDLPTLQAERRREMMWECWGRQDAIRFGTFGNARNPAKTADGDAHWQIFPIPTPQIQSNPNLKQNPGY